MICAESGAAAVARVLLERGADASLVDASGRTAGQIAEDSGRKGSREVADMLREAA